MPSKPKWTTLPAEPLLYNPYQAAFWNAIKTRICPLCLTEDGQHKEFEAAESNKCPVCGTKGIRKFHRATLLAGRRGGKTKAASIAAVREACIPGTIGWCCAPTDPKLHRYVIPAIQQLIPEDWVESWSAEYKDLRLKNGSLIHFQTLEHPDQGRGQGLDWVWMDEVCELTEDHWMVLRPSLTERRGLAILSSSPRSFDWVWKNFYLPAEAGTPGYWACRYSTSENPIISQEEIADARNSMSPEMFSQEYEADFVVFEGAVYGAALDAQILSDTSQIRNLIPEWPAIHAWRQVLVGIDTGADHPFGATKIVATERGLVVVGEYLERNKTFAQHVGAIQRLANSHATPDNPVRFGINKNERQPMIELAQHGMFCQPSENEVVAGTERVKSWLSARQLWFWAPSCPKTIEQMKSYRWAPDKMSDGQIRKEKVFKRNDELPDCIRYAVMTWPRLPAEREVSKPLRDISGLPEEMQATILRHRKIEQNLLGTEKEPVSVVEDFYL